jgi:amidophosphoribosyltransferase
VISDTDPQPLIIGSHLGTFGIVTVGRINNMDDLVKKAFAPGRAIFPAPPTASPTPPKWRPC